MKGFPNQVAELGKLANGMRCLLRLVDAGENAKDDGIFGQALVRAGVAGTGHAPKPVDDYIREQLTKAPGNQSFRTTARGLRELYRLMQLIDDSGPVVQLTALGRQAATFAGTPMNAEQAYFWRRIIRNMTHGDGHGVSHPYQVLLRLVARKPGITRAKCALALEANNDSLEEIARIAELADLPENEIRVRIGVSQANWDNAKKVLPKFAEQLGDVIRSGQSFVIASAPGRADERVAVAPALPVGNKVRNAAVERAPRTSRAVTPENIGRAGIVERSDEIEVPIEGIDPRAIVETNRLRIDRLRRHNLLVRELAARLAKAGARLYEDPFDILALIAEFGILVEVKTLDGTEDDERERVRDALAQLLYYEAFMPRPVTGEAAIKKVACFERRIGERHRTWLNGQEIATIWKEGEDFVGDALATEFLGRHLKDLR